MLFYLQIIILAIIQGACELLPVSSSAHVIVAEKLMGFDPTSPEMTMLLVMLHTGTMFAVIVYFWRSWKQDYFTSSTRRGNYVLQIVIATAFTGGVYYGLKTVIVKIFMRGVPHAEIENLFSNLPLIACALAAAGVLIIWAGLREVKAGADQELQTKHSIWIGIMQGFCLPFRGFSRSGSTISTGLLFGLPKRKVEEFSFALGVVLTPAAIGQELHRLIKAHALSDHSWVLHQLGSSLLGMVFSFIAGLLALKWLSRWLENGQWKFFGFYCLVAAAGVLAVHFALPG